ncbi:hypothetical protein [Nostoc sp.]|uniref:hypothetical protein n=1 Tax=Nostoc sp. TaxID=1180 RepID=UPI002FFCDDBA
MLLTHKENILKFSWLLPSFLSLFLFGSSVKAAAIANVQIRGVQIPDFLKKSGI